MILKEESNNAKKIRKHFIIQASIFIVLAFGLFFPIFPDSSITLKLFMFFMGIGCGVSLSGSFVINRKHKNIQAINSGKDN